MLVISIVHRERIEILDMEETGRLSDLNGEQTEGIEKIDLNDDLQELHSNCLIQEVTGKLIGYQVLELYLDFQKQNQRQNPQVIL